jgi:drug/metabolite transporter superfamily protein YnfA
VRIFLVLLAAVGALAGIYLYFVPLLITNGSAVLGGLGVLLLVIAAVLPRRKPKCQGHHCPGCSHH